jgi:hypothetical protein
MEPDPVLGQPANGVVESLHADHGELPVVLRGRLGVDHVPVLGDGGIVELEDEAGVHDGPVLLPHGVGAGEEELLLGLVVPVADARGAARSDRREEAFLGARSGERSLDVVDVGLDGGLPGVGQRADAHRPERGAGAGGDPRVGVRVGRRKPEAIAPVGEAGQHHLPRLRAVGRHVVEALGAQLEAAQPVERVAPPRPVVHPVAHGLAVFAVAGDVDARVALPAHHVGHRGAERGREGALV